MLVSYIGQLIYCIYLMKYQWILLLFTSLVSATRVQESSYIGVYSHGGDHPSVLTTINVKNIVWTTSLNYTLEGINVLTENVAKNAFSRVLREYIKKDIKIIPLGTTVLLGDNVSEETGNLNKIVCDYAHNLSTTKEFAETLYVSILTSLIRPFSSPFCAYHTYATCDLNKFGMVNVKYSFFYDITNDFGCSRISEDLKPNNYSLSLNNIAGIYFHELFETITDANTHTGFLDVYGNEIADLCAWIMEYITLDKVRWYVQGIWSNEAYRKKTGVAGIYGKGYDGCVWK